MFEVVCVLNKKIDGGGQDAPELKVGSIYTVLQIICGGRGYVLKEVDPGTRYLGYSTEYFSPLNGPDERDMAEERQKNKALRIRDKVQVLLNQTTPA